MNGWDRAGLLPLFVAAGHACSREPSGHKAAPEPEPGSRAAAAPSPVPPGLDLPAAVEGFSASAPTTGPGFVRRAYDRGAARVTVTLAPLDLGPGGYERWLVQSRGGYPQAAPELVPPGAGNGFYECADDAATRCNLLVQLRSGVHLEIRGDGAASRADVDAVAAALPLRAW
ncbi:MAG TPA: hypothetical protein VE987_11235 [Polyangiaceae bacterium]|nr:hypothetical protein [Polyangiaceae bacterium]